MNKYQDITTYLLSKIDRASPDSKVANFGAVTLKKAGNYEANIDKYIEIAFQILQGALRQVRPSAPAGQAKLTSTSMTIGKVIYQELEIYDASPHDQVRLGNLFVEAFMQCGFVTLFYPKQRNSSYNILATDKWSQLGDLVFNSKRLSLLSTSYKPSTAVMVKDNKHNYENHSAPWVRAVQKLSATGWIVNEDVLDAMIENKHLFVSDVPELAQDKELKRQSKNVEWAAIMTKAEMLRDSSAFYQSVECDYRGRIYYNEPFLNFQGPDLARGLMQFAKAKPMTESGEFWLAVHTASSYNASYNKDEIPEWCEEDYREYLLEEGLDTISVDKMSLEDRVRWTNEHMDLLLEAGDNKTIFPNAEKPISLLACCLEWVAIEKAKLEGRIHLSHIPIPVDGQANGWQHLAAISKDSKTGDLVGLLPREFPQDFYVQTAKVLYELTKGNERLHGILTKMPMKHIRKGISKRGSMTRAYSSGATRIGENMWVDCRQENFDVTYGITEEDCMALGKLLIRAIEQVCPGPLKTMAYLQALAAFELGTYDRFDADGNEANKEYKELSEEIAELRYKKDKTDEEKEHFKALREKQKTYKTVLVHGNGARKLTWKTKSGFKVNFKANLEADFKCQGTITGVSSLSSKASDTINHVLKVQTDIPSARDFMCGISPNWVHASDGAHMALVIDQWDGDFGAVHDSFSTHACDVEDLLMLTKQVFINMYATEDSLEDLKNQIVSDKSKLDVDAPERGDLDVSDVAKSDFFFS